MCNVHAVITNGLLHVSAAGGDLKDVQEETLTYEFVPALSFSFFALSHIPLKYRDRKEHRVFLRLLHIIPRFFERLANAKDDELMIIADLVRLAIRMRYFLICEP